MQTSQPHEQSLNSEELGARILGDAVSYPKPMVSVIIIFLNTERFIEEAIESVLAQTYAAWELLLVDDGSTDTSTAIALRYAEQYAGRIRYLDHEEHQNRGMSASRNLGIRNAKGEYIAFLDADDVWLPHKLEQQVAILEQQPEAAMVYGPAMLWHSWAKDPQNSQQDLVMQDLGVPLNTLAKPPVLVTFLLERAKRGATPVGILVRRQIAEGVGGFEESFRGSFEDMVFATKICLSSPVFVSQECWLRYRQHPNSCCAVVQRTGQLKAMLLSYLDWLEDYLVKTKCKDDQVWIALQRKLWPYRHPIRYYLSTRARLFKQQVKDLVKLAMQWILPISVYHWLLLQWRRRRVGTHISKSLWHGRGRAHFQ